jgi:hypothetical protein
MILLQKNVFIVCNGTAQARGNGTARALGKGTARACEDGAACSRGTVQSAHWHGGTGQPAHGGMGRPAFGEMGRKAQLAAQAMNQ